MKPSELYKIKPESISYDLNFLLDYHLNIPEIGGYFTYDVNKNLNKRIAIYFYRKFNIDSRRVWILAAVKFDNEFVMVTQNAGREGEDYHNRFITNEKAYQEMLNYFITCMSVIYEREEDGSIEDGFIVNEEEDIKSLDKFYNETLTGDIQKNYY